MTIISDLHQQITKYQQATGRPPTEFNLNKTSFEQLRKELRSRAPTHKSEKNLDPYTIIFEGITVRRK